MIKNNKHILFFLLLNIFLIAIGIISEGKTSLITIILLLGLCFTYFIKLDRITYIIVFLIFAIPYYDTGLFPIIMDIRVSIPLTFILISAYLGKKLIEQSKFNIGSYKVLIFILWAYLSLFQSFSKSFDITSIIQVSAVYLLFICYYVFYDIFSQDNIEKHNKIIMLLISILLLFISVLYHIMMSKGIFYGELTERVVTAHYNIFPFIFPLLLNILLTNKNISNKFKVLIPLILSLYIILVCQSRIIWIVILIESFIIYAFYVFLNKNFTEFFKKMIILSLIVLLLSIPIYSLIKQNLNLLYRLKTMSLSVIDKDPSLQHRISAVTAVIKNKLNPSILVWIFGGGLGDGVDYISLAGNHYDVEWIDNSYIMTIWHIGIVGLLIYFYILYTQVRNGVFLIRYSKEDWKKNFGVVLITYVIGIIIMGLTSAIFIKYRFNILWAALWAYSDALVMRIKKEVIHD